MKLSYYEIEFMVSTVYLLFFQIDSDNLHIDNQRNSRLQPKVHNMVENNRRSKNGQLSEKVYIIKDLNRILCTWKHSQYFFTHCDFLQLHPILCLADVVDVDTYKMYKES
jgi:hypothetical protein